MKATQLQLLPFLEGKKQFIIPIYQRTYSWTREQCTQLWNDIVNAATNQTIKGHFIGSIVYIHDGLFRVAAIPQLLVIDGQQRLTTLSLLLLALTRAAQEKDTNDEVDHHDIYESYLINKHGRDEQRYKLLLTQDDKEELIALIDGKEHMFSQMQQHGINRVTGRLTDNYHFFEEQIRQSNIDLKALYMGLNKLIIVDIALDRDFDNPQLIFESLNSTGVDLSQADLIRNYVLMGLDSEAQNQLYKDYWSPMERLFPRIGDENIFDRFMRDYLTLKQGTIPNIDKVYSNFKTYHLNQGEMSIATLVADIYRYATYYVNMALLWESDGEIKRVLHDINALKVDVAYPFLLEVYDDYAQKRLSRQDFIAILKLVESYLFRRAICGIPTNTLNKVFATLAKEIDKEHYLESVQMSLLQKDSYRRFPSDDEFQAAFVIKDVYNFRLRNYLLRKLENAGQKEFVNIESCTIEHIMPQNQNLSIVWQQELGPDWKTIHNLYLHTIGNLTLTGYNSELSDRPFQEKCTMTGGFIGSPIRLNASLKHVEHWNKDEIEKRAALLAEQAVKIWAIPHLAMEQVNNISKPKPKTPLAEVIGPVEHPLAGFIPAGFKLVQVAEKRFNLFREVDGEWVVYGDGAKIWYAISWEYAGKWTRDKQRKNEYPLSVNETVNTLLSPVEIIPGVVLNNSLQSKVPNGGKNYTLNDHIFLQGNPQFEEIRKRVLNLDASVTEVINRGYVAYKLSSNFVAITGQKKRLIVSLYMPFDEVHDPHNLCRDVSNGNGHYGKATTEIHVTSLDQIDDVMDIIRQSFEQQLEMA